MEQTRPALRKDAARNRRRIVEAARELVRQGKPVQLNAVAQHAGVGVGTVYRHFATPEALTGELAADRFRELIDEAGEAAARSGEASAALRTFLRSALTAYLHDDTFAAVIADPAPAAPEVQALRHELLEALRGLVARAPLRPELTTEDVMDLLCGIGFAVRHAGDRDPAAAADRYLTALLDGALVPRS